MLKKDTLGKASAKSLGEAFKCGECLHFDKHPHSSRQEICSKEGVRAVGTAPKCFTPDVSKVAQNVDQFVQVITIFQSFSHKQQRILLGLLRGKKRKIAIGTKLYFKVGRDYVSNYLCGYVAGYTSGGELMIMGSPEKARGNAFLSFVSPQADDLLTWPQWKLKRAELKAANKLFDPTNRVIKKSSVKDDYEPPSIDKAPRELYDKLNKSRKKRRTSDVVDQMSFNVT
jgi:hypothetical protein